VRDGRWLVGMGVAAAFRNNLVMKSGARVRLDASGIVTVETDMTDIGTGSYTIIAQTAAEMMGVPLDKVVVRLGDSSFPVSAARAASGAQQLHRRRLCRLRQAARGGRAEARLQPADAEFADGQVRDRASQRAAGRGGGDGRLVAEDRSNMATSPRRFSNRPSARHFVEVGVDAATGEIRIRRMLAVCAAGRILNPKSARSQVIGAMTMGVGAALMEELAVDKRFGFFVNHDLAGYEVPVHADIPHQEVIFLDETDPMSSPMKAKGVGELGICGVGAAIANAVYNATGVRVRDYPITLDKLLSLSGPAGPGRGGWSPWFPARRGWTWSRS
jgi:xanthine dehydrogenase YagR molybdenum-binding subunit